MDIVAIKNEFRLTLGRLAGGIGTNKQFLYWAAAVKRIPKRGGMALIAWSTNVRPAKAGWKK